MNKVITFIKTYYRFITSIILLSFALISLIVGVYAWFTINSSVDTSSIDVVTSNDNVHFRDRIRIKRYYGNQLVFDKWYYRENENNKNYYEYDFNSDSYILDDQNNKIPMKVTSLFPNEYIDISLWYYPDEEASENTYSLSVGSFDDTNGRFEEIDSSTNNSYTHSALGVFRVGKIDIDEDEEVVNNWSYLCQYNGDYLEDTKFDNVRFYNGSFKTEEGVMINNKKYYQTNFRIQLNFDQYYNKLIYASTNVLSEKVISIGSIKLIA